MTAELEKASVTSMPSPESHLQTSKSMMRKSPTGLLSENTPSHMIASPRYAESKTRILQAKNSSFPALLNRYSSSKN